MKKLACIFALSSIAGLAVAQEPDGLILPPGFHATLVSEGVGPARHIAVSQAGNVYISVPPKNPQGVGGGIVALHLDAQHHADKTERFGTVDGGTAIRFHNGALYAASPSGIYRFPMKGQELVPTAEPELIVDGMPTDYYRPRANRAITFDGKGNLIIGLASAANLCTDPKAPQGAPVVGRMPCPDLNDRAGVWQFNATKVGQKFLTDGEKLATGIRDTSSVDWSPADGNLYGIMHGRDNTNKQFPQFVSDDDEANIADEMHKITKGTDFGWPYTYYDGVKKLRLVSPEYGGDGKKVAEAGKYSTPMLTFQSWRSAPVDLIFYRGNKFPAAYRRGAFIVQHGTHGKNYSIAYVPFNKSGMAGPPQVFADGFANFDPKSATPLAPKYRATGVAEASDGSLYVVDSQKGRVWRIAYGE